MLSPVQIDGGLTSQLRSASPPAPLRMARGVICEVTPIGLLTYFVKVFLSQSTQSSLSIFAHSFEPTERLRHTEVTEAFQLRLAVTFCEIG